jgi:RNA polymerase sigma factor (sigma-70 family)
LGRAAKVDTSSWPHFLDLLDVDPDGAFEAFYRLALDALTNVPPRPMRSLADEDRQDLIHDVIYHCVRDDFRVLRRYVDRGKPFAAWLYAVAHNKSLDYVRGRALRPETVSIHGDSERRGPENLLSDPSGSGEKRLEYAEILSTVRDLMKRLGEYCRMLLEMAADEFTPKEMVLVLRLPADQNKKISADLRYCREKLRKQLALAGVDVASVF